MRPFLFIFILFVCTGAIFAQQPEANFAVNIEKMYLAKDDGTGKAGDASTNFFPADIPIYCVVQLDSSVPVTVKMNLVAEKVPGVKADTKVVSVSYTTKDGQNRVNFSGKPSGKWVVGTYRVDIFLDNKFAKNLSFEIKTPIKNAESATLIQPTPSRPSVIRKKN